MRSGRAPMVERVRRPILSTSAAAFGRAPSASPRAIASDHGVLQPRHQMLNVEAAFIEELHEIVVDYVRIRSDRVAVDSEKDIGHGERHSLVSVHERVVLNEAFQKCGSLVNDRFVVARLRAMKSGFERAYVAYPGRAAITLDQK